MATLKELRATRARAQEALRAADGKVARVDADLVVARNQLQELHGQLASGARVAAQLAALAARVEALEAEREVADKEAEAARDDLDDATTNEQEFVVEAAEDAASKAPDLNDTLGLLQRVLDEAQTDAARHWAKAALSLVRAAIAMSDAPTNATFGGRSAREHLREGLTAHFELLKSIIGTSSSVTFNGELHVPDDAAIEERGISHGGRDRLHWEAPAVFRGRRGTAYVELYLTRETRR